MQKGIEMPFSEDALNAVAVLDQRLADALRRGDYPSQGTFLPGGMRIRRVAISTRIPTKAEIQFFEEWYFGQKD